MKFFTALAAALPVAIAAPKPDCCNNIDWLISANHASSNAATFCTKFLHISTSTVTKCATTSVTGSQVTVTTTATAKTAATVSSTATVTNTVTTSTTTYATSTCTPATPYTPPATTAAATTTSAQGPSKRGTRYPDQWCWQWDWPYPTPKYNPSQISQACSCIATTPTATVTSTSTITKPGPTTTTTKTTTITTSTYTVLSTVTTATTPTNTVTSTELRPYQPTGIYQSPNNATFDEYNGIDFQRGDLDGGDFCSCDSDGSGGDCTVRGVDYGKCTGFDSCQDICASINNNAGSLVCVAVTYNGPDASGACYFKSSLEGCGYFNDGRRSGQIELNGYKYASSR